MVAGNTRRGGRREAKDRDRERTNIKNPHSKDKLWKTFTEVAEEEHEFLKKYFASQELNKMSSVSSKEDALKKDNEKKQKTKKESSIFDIYDKALAKLPKLETYGNTTREILEVNNEDINDYGKLSNSTCYEILPVVQIHKEIYYNSEFQDQLSSIHNRPLPPIPQ